MSLLLDEILKRGEGQTIEFKSSFSDEVIISLVAFSNAQGGTVYIGINDRKEVVGVTLGKETVASWMNEIKNKTAPTIIPDIDIWAEKEKIIVTLSVIEYPIKPVSTKGRYYKRRVNSNRMLVASEVADMYLRTMNSSWDAYVDPMHTIDDLDLEKVQRCIERLRLFGKDIVEDPVSFLRKKRIAQRGRQTYLRCRSTIQEK